MCRVTYGCGVWGSLVPLFSPHPKKKMDRTFPETLERLAVFLSVVSSVI